MHETPFFRFAGSMVFPAFRCPRILCLAANEKDFSHSLEMTNAGRRYSRIIAFFMRSPWRRHSPSFPWKEVPRRGGGWNRRGMKGNMSKAVSRIVIPSGAEGSFSFAIFCFMRESVCMKHRSSDSQGARCFPLAAILTSFVLPRTKKISRFCSK